MNCLLAGSALAVFCTLMSKAAAEPQVLWPACLPENVRASAVSGPDERGIYTDLAGNRYYAADLAGSNSPLTGRPPEDGGIKSVLAYPAGPQDRWGLRPAWLVVTPPEEAGLLQYELLLSGREIFAPHHALGDCAELLRGAEKSSRVRAVGRWADKAGRAVYSALDPQALQEAAGDYVIVQGRIVSLGKTRRTRYLNFGRHWKTDFTVTISEADAGAFEDHLAGRDMTFADLAGRAVEIRGVVQIDDGPRIDLRHVPQLDILD